MPLDKSSSPADGSPSTLDPLISICVPTCNRPELLRVALDSCFAQTWPRFEVVIGDDSRDDRSERLVADYARRFPGKLRYRHHKPALGQNGNVNDLFLRAAGPRLLLLHDDDLLLPSAVEALAHLWDRSPTLDAAFGKQLLIEHDGSPVSAERSHQLNVDYGRTAANAGLQPLPVVAGITRMFPNDGFLVTSSLARRIGYRPMCEVGHACDTDFGLRFCAVACNVWFLDEYTLCYRISRESISKYSTVTPYTFDLLSALRVPAAALPALTQAKRNIASSAASGFARLGKTRRALSIFFSRDYPSRQRFSPRGIFHLLLIVKSIFLRPVVETRKSLNPAPENSEFC